MAERPLYTLYKNLKAQNFDVPDDYDQFENVLTKQGKASADNRHKIYENLKNQNFDVPDSYEQFYSALFQPSSRTTSRAKGGSVPMSNRDKLRFMANASNISQQAGLTMKKASQDRYNTLKNRQEKRKKDFGRVNIGTNQNPYGGDAGNVVKDDFAYNPETGKAGTFVNSDNEDINSLAEAQQRQAALDKQNQAYQEAVDTGQIASVFDVRDKNGNYDLQENAADPKTGTYITEEGLKAQYEKRLADAYARKDELERMIAEDNTKNGNPLLSYSASMGGGSGSSEERRLMDSSLGQVKSEIASLEAVTQTDNNAWYQDMFKALDNTAFTAKTWDFGISDFAAMSQMERIKSKIDNKIPLNAAEKTFLKSKLGADSAAALEDEKMGRAYRWTKIAGQSLPFMADFFLTGGFGGITKATSRAALKYAAKRGMGKLSTAILKNTGVIGADIIGSYAMAGTEQAFKTGADIMNRHMGTLYQDENGDYAFGTFDENGNLLHNGGESFGKALYKGFTAAMLENYTEKIFGHNYGIKKGALNAMEKLGMSRSAEFFKNIGKKEWYAGSKKWMKKFGIDGFGEEVMEEEINIPLNALLVGDNKFSDILDPKQQLDIIGGMALSVGSMYAMGLGTKPLKGVYNRAQYYRLKNVVGHCDTAAYNAFGNTDEGKQKWEDLRNQIDSTPNEDLGKVLAGIVRSRDTMTKEQIGAAVQYAINLQEMRGYNLAKTAEMNAREITNEPQTPEEKHEEEIDNAYSEGQETPIEDTHEIQLDQSDKQKTLAERLGITEQQLSGMTDEQLDSLTGQNDELDQAIYDYQLSSARYQGVIDNAQDKVDQAVLQAEQETDMLTDKNRGTVRNATIKATQGEEDYNVYIISGNIATNEDGTINVSDSDDMILYFDPKTKTVEHADALRFAALGSEENADEVKARVVAEAKEKAIKEVAGIIDGTVGEGSQFTMTDENGIEHTYEILSDNGDGTAMVTIDGNVDQNPHTFEELQQLKDNEDQRRLEAAKIEREQMEAERAIQNQQPNVQPTETVPPIDFDKITNNDGNIVMVDVVDENGNTLYDGSQLFLISSDGVKAKVMEMDENGNLKPHAVDKSKIIVGETMSLDEYKQSLSGSSELEGNGGVEDNSVEEEPQPIGNGAFGNIYNQFKGKVKEAFDFLLKHKSGDLLGVFHRDDVGDIDLVWGDRTKNQGVDHIIDKHIEQHNDFSSVDEAMSVIDDVVNNGTINEKKSKWDKIVLEKDGYSVVIRKNLRDNNGNVINDNKNWVVTAFESEHKQGEKKVPSDVTLAAPNINEGSRAVAPDETSVGKDSNNISNDNEEKQTLTLSDGTVVPTLEDGNPDFSQLTASQTAELYDSQFGDDAEQLVSSFVSDAKKALDKATNMKVKGNSFVEQKASKAAKDNAIADAQAKYDSAVAIRDAYNELQLNKALETHEGRMSLIDKAKNKFARLKNKEEWKNQTQALWNETVGAVLHRLYDGLSTNVFDNEPQTLEEYVGSLLKPFSLNYEGSENGKGVKQETGMERGNFAKSKILAKEGSGETVDSFVHRLWENRPPQFENATDQDIRNTVLDLITSDMNAYDMSHVIENNRIAQAEKEIEDRKFAEENAAPAEETTPEETSTEQESQDQSQNEDVSSDENAAPAETETEEGASEDLPFEKPSEDSDAPFSVRDNENDSQDKGGKSQSNRAEDVEKNRVDNIQVVDDIVGRKTRKAFDRLAKMMGAKIQWQYSDKLGNGWYEEKVNDDGTVERIIYITLDSSIEQGAQFIFGHEMTHEIKSKSPQAYEELKKVIVDTYGTDVFEKAVDETEKRYRDAGVNYSAGREAYEEEVVADGIGEMIRDLNLAHTLSLKMSHPLLAYLHEIIQKIKRAFYDTPYTETIDQVIRNIEQAYVKAANGTFESSPSGERLSLRDKEVNEANERFNNEIEDFKNKSHKGLMHLGTPSPILRASGVNVEEITLSPKVLNKKLNQHSLTTDDVKDLVKAIQNPIMVYKHGETKPNIVVITNAEIRGNKLSIALELDADGNVTELNNVSSVHDKDAGKEVERWLSWDDGYFENALKWVDKEKVSDWLSSAHLISYSQTENNQKLSSLAKVINDFENPTVEDNDLTNDNENVQFSLRKKEEPKKKGIGYKVFVLKDGKLYPPMVANPNGAATPVGVWLDADAAPIAGESKTGRPQVKQGGKGTQGGSGKLAYRPGWHLGVIPYAIQFNRKDAEGNKSLFPKNFVFAEVEYAADVDYQDEARKEGINPSGKYQHSLAGLKHLPTDGYYMYRTNPNPETDPWVITGAMKVNRLLTRAEQADLVKKAGREPQMVQEGDIVTDEAVNAINQEIANAPKFSIKTYHGSQASFDHFDHSFMGSGEGAQAYGWGTYVSEVKGIAKAYANQNARKRSNEASKVIEQANENYKQAKSDVDGTQYDLNITKSLLKQYQDKLENARKNNRQNWVKEFEQRVKSFEDDIANMEKNLKKYNEILAERQKELDEAKSKNYTYFDVESELSNTKSGLEYVENDLKDSREYTALMEKRLKEAKEELQKAKESGTGFGVDMLEEDVAYYSRKVDEYKEKSQRLENDAKDIKDKVDSLQKKLDSMEKPRNLYTVEIPDDTGSNYLGWDGDAPQKVIDRVKKDLGISDKDADHVMSQYHGSGEGLYRLVSMFSGNTRMGSDKEASKYLSSIGYDGVKVIAQRNTGGNKDGRMNYVIFDENNAKIVDHTKFSLRNIDKVNNDFNDALEDFTLDNADKITFNLGMPSDDLLSGGVANKPLKLYGSKLAKKIRKHDFEPYDLKDLPKSMQHPIAVFNNHETDGNRSVLTELKIKGDNVLVSVTIGKGQDADINIISSTHGKRKTSVIEWFKKGLATFVNKKKAQEYLHLAAPIAAASNTHELNSAAKIDNSSETSKGNGEKFSLKDNDLKKAQLDIINKTNPMLDDYHTGIRKVDDIKTFKEAYEAAKAERDKYGDEQMSSYPDETDDILDDAMENGEITIYSSKPIKNGNFVTPSRMQAEDYAGGGKVYEKTVPVSDVAWIDVEQGQYAKVGDDVKFSLGGLSGAATADKAEEGITRLANFNVALKMEKEKKDAKSIKMATGWERGADGKWRYEMPDAKLSEYMDIGGKKVKRFEEDMLWTGGKLGDVVDAPELFKAYPQLKDVELDTDSLTNGNPSNGEYNHATHRITIHASNLKYLNNLLNHEIQHAIQYIEGFAKGGNPAMFSDSYAQYAVFDGLVKERFGNADYETLSGIIQDKDPEFSEFKKDLGKEWNGFFKNEKANMKYQKESDYMNAYHKFVDEGKKGSAFEQYWKLAGEVEARNVEKRLNMTPEERRNSLASETEDTPREEQQILFSLKAMADGKEDSLSKLSDSLSKLTTADEVDETVKKAVDAMPVGWKMANKKAIHIAQALAENRKAEIDNGLPKFSLRKNTLIKDTLNDTPDGGNETKFSLRYDQYKSDLDKWKKDNGLSKDAQRPTIPLRNPGESAADFMNRMREYRKQMALWKTAPVYEAHLLTDGKAMGEFNRELQRGSVLKRIAFQDSMLAIRKAQEAIMKEHGIDALNMAEDAYTAENRSHGKGKNELEEYNDEFLQPLRKAYNDMRKLLDNSYDNVKVYMMAKHGIERNAQIAFREALKNDFEDETQRMAAYNGYKTDVGKLMNDIDLMQGTINYVTWRQRDNAFRIKYAPSFLDYRYDKMGIVMDYSGLSSLFEGASDIEQAAYDLATDVENKAPVETERLWRATNAATKKILRDSYKAGMMSKANYEYVRDMYERYIPLRGWQDTNADQVWDYIGGGKGAFNQALRTADGRTSVADDPIAYIENMAESGILINNKNWVKQHLMLLAENHPTSLLTLSKAWYVKSTDAQGNETWIPASPQITSGMTAQQVRAALDSFEKKMEQKKQKGEATQQRGHLEITYPQTNSEEREHQVRVMKDGEEYVVYVNGDPQLAQAMNNTRAHRVREVQSGKLDRMCAFVGRKLAAAYTSLSPLFIPSNYFRDLTMTLASTAIREDGRYNYLLRKNLATSWGMFGLLKGYKDGSIREKVRNGQATDKEQMFYDFMMNGGETGFVSSFDIEDLKKKFKSELKDMNRTYANPKKVGHVIMDGIEFMNRAIENSNRFAIYMTSIQYGRSIEEAVNNAKDVTLNFNRKGTGEYGWQTIRNLYLFINPAIQSLQTLGALAKHHKFKFTAVTATWLASGALMPLVNVAMMKLINMIAGAFGGDDDEYKDMEEKYWQFSKWDRRNNMIMWIPFTKAFVKIPLAQEFRGFYGIGDMIASKLMGGETAQESWSQYGEDLLGQVVDMLPLDPTGYDGNVAVSLMPNAIRPIFELAFNVDFTGKPLFKDSEYNKYDPNFTKAYAGTPDWLVRVSKMVNSIGNDYPDVQQNAIDSFGDPRYNLNNPAVVDHVLSSYLGGAYTMGSQVAGLLTKALNDPKEIKLADIPLFSKFASNPDDRPLSKKQGDDYWETKENHDRAANTISKLKKQAKVDGDYSLLEQFYGSKDYEDYKLADVKVKQYQEDKKKEQAENTGEEYFPHKLTAEDVYKKHSTARDDFEDMKLKQIYTKLNGIKTSYDLIKDTAPKEADGFYNQHKTAIDAITSIDFQKGRISDLKKDFIYNGKDKFDEDKMNEIRKYRKEILSVLDKANKILVKEQK